MKIGLVRRGYSPSGGAERYLLRFAEALRATGHTSILFGSQPWPAGTWQGEFIAVHGDSPRAFADSLESLRPREHCDLVFSLDRVWTCDSCRAGDGVHAAYLRRRRAFEPAWKSWFRSLQPKHRDLMELERSLFGPAGAKVIIANSRMVADEIAACFHTPTGRLRVIHNGLPVRATAEIDRTSLRAGFGIEPQQTAVLFAGSGWERKGLRYAIEAVDRLPNALLLVAGAGRRNSLPRSANVRFLGEVPSLHEVMEAADLFALPTIYEPFSNACLEALAAGLPVITTTANGFAEIMRPGEDGDALPNPADIGALAAALEKWRGAPNRDARREYGAGFTIDRNVRLTLEAILPEVV